MQIFREQFALTTLLVLLTACYNRVPLGLGVPEPDARIIARLTDTGADRMAGTIGVAATEIEGIVASATDSIWQLYLVRVDQRGGGSTIWNREPVSFPRSALTDPIEKRLDKKKSWLSAGALTVGAFLFARLLRGPFSGEEPRGPPLPPPV
jgi:hypothetical protein